MYRLRKAEQRFRRLVEIAKALEAVRGRSSSGNPRRLPRRRIQSARRGRGRHNRIKARPAGGVRRA